MDHQGVSSLQRVGWDHRERDEPWTCGGEMEMGVELRHLSIKEYPR